MEQLTKNQAVATSQEAVQNQNEPQLRDENAHNDKSVHGVLNPTYQAGLRRDAVQPDIEAERKKRETFISRHNSNFFSDKLVLTSVTPASSAPVLQTPKATSSTLYFDSLTVNAGNGGFLHCIQMDTSVNAANQVVSVGADI